jgi:hypothetical protein
VAFSDAFERITHVVAEWGSLFALTADRKMYRLDEKGERERERGRERGREEERETEGERKRRK